MISEVKIGAVFLKKSSAHDELKMLAAWPENNFESMTEKLYELAEKVINSGDTVPQKITCHLDEKKTICDTITLPLRYENRVIGTVIFLQSIRSEEQKKAISQLFQWGCKWLESTLAATHEEQNKLHPLVNNLVKLSLQDVPVAVSWHHICNLLTKELECKRTALGTVKGLQIHTLALSDQVRFNKRTSQIHKMEAAMEEAVDQKQAILYPKAENMLSSVTHKHHALSEALEDACILTIPLFNNDDPIGAILLLRPRKQPFTEQELKILHHSVELLAPALALNLRNENSLLTLFFQKVKKKVGFIFNMEHLLFKFSILGLMTLLTTLTLLKTEYYTYAKSSLEGAIQQVIVAPQNGFIKSSDVRAGDKVVLGQIMVSLDNRDLTLEHKKLLSEHSKVTKEYREALALRERAKVSIFSAQIAQVDAQLSLIKEKLNRSQLKAPFSGIVVSGDLSQSLGAPVEKGEELFKVSPLGNYRVALSIDDHDISNLKIGQNGSVRLVGLPYDKLPIVISHITPVTAAEHGGNYFRVEATLTDRNDSRLRPGMQGISKVKVGEKSILWVWTHSLIERLRLWFWSIGV